MSETYERLKRMDHTHLWHPFTQMQEWMEEDPCIIAGGEGSYLIDVHGVRYLDGVSSLWCNLFGHRRPELDEALKAWPTASPIRPSWDSRTRRASSSPQS